MKIKLNHLKWGVILTYVSLFLNIALSIIYTPLMLRVLGQSEHGLYSTISTTMSWLSLLSLGFGSSYIRYYSRYKAREDEKQIASLNGMFLILFGTIGIVALICGIFISFNLQYVFGNGITPDQYTTARILSIIVTFDFAIGFPASVFASIIRANEKFIQVKLINLFQCITTPLVTLPILYMGYGSVGMVVCTTIVDAIAYIINTYYCFKKLHIKVSFRGYEKGIFKDMVGFSAFIALNSVISKFNTGLDSIFITRYVNTAAASIYAIGYSLYSYYSSFSSAVSSVFVPRIYRIVNASEDDAKMRMALTTQFVKLGRIQFYIQMLLCTGIIFFGRPFILLWAGNGYGDSYVIALLLCVAYTVPLCQNIGVEIQRAQNKHKIRTIVYAIMTVINVVLTIILCQKWGPIGAAIGTAVSIIAVDVIFMNIYYHKKLNIDILCFWKNICRISVGLIIPIIVGIGINKAFDINSFANLLPFIVLYTLIYGLSMWFLSMNKEEHEMLAGVILRRLKK